MLQAAPLGGDAGQVDADQHLIGGPGVGGDDERAADQAVAERITKDEVGRVRKRGRGRPEES